MLEIGVFALVALLYLYIILISALTMHQPPVKSGYDAALFGPDGQIGAEEVAALRKPRIAPRDVESKVAA